MSTQWKSRLTARYGKYFCINWHSKMSLKVQGQPNAQVVSSKLSSVNWFLYFSSWLLVGTSIFECTRSAVIRLTQVLLLSVLFQSIIRTQKFIFKLIIFLMQISVVNYEGVTKNVMGVGFQEDGRWMYTGWFLKILDKDGVNE
jgi:hypothetical protein